MAEPNWPEGANSFGAVLLGLRKRLNLTQAEIALHAGSSTAMISRAETGRLANPHRLLDGLSRVPGVTAEEVELLITSAPGIDVVKRRITVPSHSLEISIAVENRNPEGANRPFGPMLARQEAELVAALLEAEVPRTLKNVATPGQYREMLRKGGLLPPEAPGVAGPGER